MKLKINKWILKNVPILGRIVLSFAPNDNFAHLIQNFRNAGIRWITKRLQVDECRVQFPKQS